MVSSAAAAGSTTDWEQTEDDVFSRIDTLYELGEINADERILYRVAALRDPARLPEELSTLQVRTESPVESKSQVMFEAFKALKEMTPHDAADLTPMLSPLPPLNYYLEQTTPFPLRVYYDYTTEQSKAQAILDAAALSYQREVQDWGFWEPPIDPANGHYEVFIDDAGGGGAYTAPYAENTATAHADAFSYIVMDRNNNISQMPVIFAHEFNHACQASFDMWERWAFYEATATYIMSQVYPADWYYTEYFMPSFQGYPHKALDWQDYGGQGMGYVYGGALWVIFLESLFGDDDPSWIAGVWEDCVQPDGMMNEPDYLDAVADALASEGGFAENFLLFSQYRYFVGAKDDGEHLPGSGSWIGCEIAVEKTLTRGDLPVADQGPSPSTLPEQNGCNYIQLNMGSGSDAQVEVEFDGQAGVLWNVDVMVVSEDEDTVVETMTLAGTGGEHSVAVGSGDRVVLVVCHLADSTYDPDFENWEGADYSYSISMVEEDPPQIDSVSPTTITQGEEGVELEITGQGFEDWDELSVEVSGEGVTVSNVAFVSETSITCTIAADADATLGDRDVVVSTDDGEITGSDLLEVLEGEAEEDSKSGDKSGCGCSTPGGSTRGWLELLSAVF